VVQLRIAGIPDRAKPPAIGGYSALRVRMNSSGL